MTRAKLTFAAYFGYFVRQNKLENVFAQVPEE